MRLQILIYTFVHLVKLARPQSSCGIPSEEALARRQYFYVGGRYEDAVFLISFAINCTYKYIYNAQNINIR